MSNHKYMTYDQAHAYIGGESGNLTEWKRNHILRLIETAKELLESGKPNGLHTVEKYIRNREEYGDDKAFPDEYKNLCAVYNDYINAIA